MSRTKERCNVRGYDGACICSRKLGHKGPHRCDFVWEGIPCGREWEGESEAPPSMRFDRADNADKKGSDNG